MTYIFNSEMTLDAVEKFMDEAGGTDEDICVVYFSCEGGSIEAAEILIDYINSNPEAYEFVATWQLHSAAFRVFSAINCKKRLFEGVWSVIHVTNREYRSRELMNKKSVDYFLRIEHDKLVDRELDGYKKILSNSEYDIVSNGGDLYVNTDRLRELFNV